MHLRVHTRCLAVMSGDWVTESSVNSTKLPSCYIVDLSNTMALMDSNLRIANSAKHESRFLVSSAATINGTNLISTSYTFLGFQRMFEYFWFSLDFIFSVQWDVRLTPLFSVRFSSQWLSDIFFFLETDGRCGRFSFTGNY